MDRLLQMESFKSGKDHSLISIYQIQLTALWTFVKCIRETTLSLIIQISFLPLKGHPDATTALPPVEELLVPICPHRHLFHRYLSESSQQQVPKRVAVEGRQRLEKGFPATFDCQHSSFSIYFHTISFSSIPLRWQNEETVSSNLSLWSSKGLPLSYRPTPNPITLIRSSSPCKVSCVILQIPGLPYYHLTCD